MKLFKFSLAALAAAGLVACGGGGGAPATTAISGIVAKGPASGAQVSFYSTQNGQKGSRLAQVTTGANGSYTVSFPVQSGPVIIEADLKGAKINDETLGEIIGQDGDFLKAVVVPLNNTALTVQVTPFSTMVANAVSGNLTPDTIAAANAVVFQMVGVNFYAENPTSGVFLTALTELSKQLDPDNPSIQDLQKQLNLALNVEGEEVKLAENISEAFCGQNANTSCSDSFKTNTADLNVPKVGDIDGTAVEQAKAVFNNLINTAKALETGVDGSIDKIATALNDAIPSIETSQIDLIARLVSDFDMLKNYQQDPNADTVKGDSEFRCQVISVSNLDKDFKITSTTARNLPLTTANANAVICRQNKFYEILPFTSTISKLEFKKPVIFNEMAAYDTGNEGEIKYVSRIQVCEKLVNANQKIIGCEPDGPQVTYLRNNRYGDINFKSSANLVEASVSGELVPDAGVSLRSGLSLKGSDPLVSKLPRQKIDLTINIQGKTVENDFRLSRATISGQSVLFANELIDKKVVEKQISSVAIKNGVLTQSSIDLNVELAAPGMKASGVVSATGGDTSGSVKFTGTIFEETATGSFAEFLQGVIDASTTGDNSGKITFTGKVFVSKNAEIELVITATESKDGSNVAGTFKFGKDTFTLSQVDNGVKVLSNTGVFFVLGDEDNPEVFVGEKIVGKFNSEKNQLEFNDGTNIRY